MLRKCRTCKWWRNQPDNHCIKPGPTIYGTIRPDSIPAWCPGYEPSTCADVQENPLECELPACPICEHEAEMGGTGLTCRCGNAACELHTCIRIPVWEAFCRHANELQQRGEASEARAAALSEALNDALGVPEEVVKGLQGRAEKAEAEVSRLREALEWVADDAEASAEHNTDAHLCLKAIGIHARKALEGK